MPPGSTGVAPAGLPTVHVRESGPQWSFPRTGTMSRSRRAKRVGAERSGAERGDADSVAEVGELERDGEVGRLQQRDHRLQVVALLPGDPHLVALGLAGHTLR